MAQEENSKISLLKTMRKNVDWKNDSERYELLDRIDDSIDDWIDGLPYLRYIFQQDEIDEFDGYPNLRDIFRQDEIELLLVDSVNLYDLEDGSKDELADRFIRFVISTGYKDEPELDEDGNPLLHRTTPLHYAAKMHFDESVRELFKIYDRFDLNYIDEDGYTHFHAACQFGCVDVVEKFLKFGQVDPNLVWPKTGDTPLLLSFGLQEDTCEKAVMLLRAGADPSLADAHGTTALHLICQASKDIDCARMILEMDEDIRMVNARDSYGHTPLHEAMREGRADLVELLLRKGADPNAVNIFGETSLHIVSRFSFADAGTEMFFKICDEEKITLRIIDAKDSNGWTPLHCAMDNRTGYLAESLLARGANINEANEDGETPLHLICSQVEDYRAKELFEIFAERRQIVRFDAKDNLGRTPLRCAVTRFQSRTVDFLLELGADLSSLVLPTEHEIDEELFRFCPDFLFVWEKASRVASVVESLAKKGYALDASQVRSIMIALVRGGLLEMSLEPDERSCLVRYLYSNNEFTVKAKEIMVTSSLSLYDLLKLRPEEATKLLACADYFKLADSNDWRLEMDENQTDEIYALLLCDMMMERFFKILALVPFLALTLYRLPISHCEIIVEKLPNEDLFKLCLLANGEN